MFIGNNVTILINDNTRAQRRFDGLLLALAKKIIEKLVKEFTSRPKEWIGMPCRDQPLGADIGHSRPHLLHCNNNGGPAIGCGFTCKYLVKQKRNTNER